MVPTQLQAHSSSAFPEVGLDTVVNQTCFHALQEPQDRYRQGVLDHGAEGEVQVVLDLGDSHQKLAAKSLGTV